MTIEEGTELVVEFHSPQPYFEDEEVVVITAGVVELLLLVVMTGTCEVVVDSQPWKSCGFALGSAALRATEGSKTAASADVLERECMM